MPNQKAVAKAPLGNTSQEVLDAVKSQDGVFWILYGDEERSAWFALNDLVGSSARVFENLSRAGIHLASGRSREAFKKRVEEHREFRDALVIEQAGWVAENVYRHGDGSIVGPRAARTQRLSVITDLPREPRFACAGTADEWKVANAPLLIDQPLCALIYAYVFAGYLVSLAPPDFQNPILEIVGETGRGKTSLAVGAGSICGGNPQNPSGFCLSWDRTNGTLDKLDRVHRDATLILNENNLTGDDAVQQAAFMRTAIMRFTEPGERETLFTAGRPVFSRLALLSTSNASIIDLIGGNRRADGAMRSRVLTVHANRPFGIFETVPAGFTSASGAVRAMVANAAIFYGTVGREFVSRVSWYRSASVARVIEESFEQLRKSSIADRLQDERSLKTLALCRVAFCLAKQFGLIPRESGSYDALLRQLTSSIDTRDVTTASSPRDIVIDYIRNHVDDFFDVEELARPMKKHAVLKAAGFWIDGGKKCIISPQSFRHVSGHAGLLKTMKASGDLECEDDRLAKKVPTTLCAPSEHCRGHFFRISKADVANNVQAR